MRKYNIQMMRYAYSKYMLVFIGMYKLLLLANLCIGNIILVSYDCNLYYYDGSNVLGSKSLIIDERVYNIRADPNYVVAYNGSNVAYSNYYGSNWSYVSAENAMWIKGKLYTICKKGCTINYNSYIEFISMSYYGLYANEVSTYYVGDKVVDINKHITHIYNIHNTILGIENRTLWYSYDGLNWNRSNHVPNNIICRHSICIDDNMYSTNGIEWMPYNMSCNIYNLEKPTLFCNGSYYNEKLEKIQSSSMYNYIIECADNICYAQYNNIVYYSSDLISWHIIGYTYNQCKTNVYSTPYVYNSFTSGKLYLDNNGYHDSIISYDDIPMYSYNGMLYCKNGYVKDMVYYSYGFAALGTSESYYKQYIISTDNKLYDMYNNNVIDNIAVGVTNGLYHSNLGCYNMSKVAIETGFDYSFCMMIDNTLISIHDSNLYVNKSVYDIIPIHYSYSNSYYVYSNGMHNISCFIGNSFINYKHPGPVYNVYATNSYVYTYIQPDELYITSDCINWNRILNKLDTNITMYVSGDYLIIESQLYITICNGYSISMYDYREHLIYIDYSSMLYKYAIYEPTYESSSSSSSKYEFHSSSSFECNCTYVPSNGCMIIPYTCMVIIGYIFSG